MDQSAGALLAYLLGIYITRYTTKGAQQSSAFEKVASVSSSSCHCFVYDHATSKEASTLACVERYTLAEAVSTFLLGYLL